MRIEANANAEKIQLEGTLDVLLHGAALAKAKVMESAVKTLKSPERSLDIEFLPLQQTSKQKARAYVERHSSEDYSKHAEIERDTFTAGKDIISLQKQLKVSPGAGIMLS